jgi:hypothetical protein
MTEEEQLRQWVRNWVEAGPVLEAIRREEVRVADNLKSIALLAPLFDQAVRSQPPRESSGMVEMQSYFAKLRK